VRERRKQQECTGERARNGRRPTGDRKEEFRIHGLFLCVVGERARL